MAGQFLVEAWACKAASLTEGQVEVTACISLAGSTGREVYGAAWSDGTFWSDGTAWSDYPYVSQLLIVVEAEVVA